MKRIDLFLLFAVLLVALWTSPAFAQAVTTDYTTEVLVLTTVTEIPVLSGRRGVEIQNRGPNAIYCALKDSTKAVLNKARELMPGDSWPLNVPATIRIWCLAKTANQVTGSATIVTQSR